MKRLSPGGFTKCIGLVALSVFVAGWTGCDSGSPAHPTSADELVGSAHPALGETVVASPKARPVSTDPHDHGGGVPAGHPPLDGGSSGTKPVAGGKTWPPGEAFQVSGMTVKPPEGWVRETPSSGMRAAQFRLPRADGDPFDGELTVIAAGGDKSSNITRWRGQFQEKPEAKVAERKVNGIDVTIVELEGTFLEKGEPRSNYRALMAIVQAPARQTFFKAFGPAATIARWEAGFNEMVDSLQPAR